MKKNLLVVGLIATVLVSCSQRTTKSDSTAVDSVAVADSMATEAMQSIDSSTAEVDSLIQQL